MSTTFLFSTEQLAELTQLRSQAELTNQYFPVYQYILDVLNPGILDYLQNPMLNVPPIDNPAVGLSYKWFVGARQVNEGTGAFATLIIEYTQRQAELRYGSTFSSQEMHNASNEVAKRVLTEILTPTNPDNTGLLPGITRIADFDANAIAKELFNNNQTDTAFTNSAAWPGAMLFPLLGSDQSWRLLGDASDGQLNTVDDLKNVLYAYDSFVYASDQISLIDLIFTPNLVNLVTQFITNLIIGNTNEVSNYIGLLYGNATATSALKLIANQGQNKIFDMLHSAYEEQPLTGTNEGSFVSKAHTFFSALGVDSQNIGLESLYGRDAINLQSLAKLDNV